MGQPIKMVKRTIGSNEYHSCSKCGHEDQIDTPIQGEFPYCNHCSKVVLDTEQNFCCWCGESLKATTVYEEKRI